MTERKVCLALLAHTVKQTWTASCAKSSRQAVEEAADLIEQQAAEIERLRAGIKAILAAANDKNGHTLNAAISRLSACKQIAAESIGEG